MHVQTSTQERLELGYGGYSCNWGVHIAGLYESKDERDEIVFGYLGQGLRVGDLQLYASHDDPPELARGALIESCPDCAAAAQDEQRLQIRTTRDLYFPDGTFSIPTINDGLDAFYAESQREGPRSVRATADMAWALEAIPGVEGLMAYESLLNYFIPGKPWISICLYDLSRFSGETIMNVLRTHPWTLSGGVITENPYFQDPDTWLAQHAPQYLGPGCR
jgi:hypothetical protein